MTKKRLGKLISEAGLKKTKFRLTMIEMLEVNESLLSAQDIYNELIKADVAVNLSTVYRTLDKLVEANIINKVDIENETQSLYEFNKDEHHHFLICTECNKIEPIYGCPLHDYENELTDKTGFLISSHKIEFYGICKECQKTI